MILQITAILWNNLILRNTEILRNNLILQNTRSSGIPQFCGITRCFESGSFHEGGGGLSYEEYMGVCHVSRSYFEGKIPERVFQFFTKIQERVIIFGRNSIVYVNIVWTKKSKMLRKSLKNESHFCFQKIVFWRPPLGTKIPKRVLLLFVKNSRKD